MAAAASRITGARRDPERPAPGSLAAVALACLVAGVAIARWTLSDEPGPPPGPEPASGKAAADPAPSKEPARRPGDGDQPEPTTPSPAPAAPAPAAGELASADPEPAGGTVDQKRAPADPSATETPAPERSSRPLSGPTEPPPFPEGPRRVRVVPGRMAYLRCDGAEIPGRSYPCPRDEALEQAVWERIERLPRCADLPTVPGEVDLRLVFRGAEQSDLTFRSSEGLDRAAIRRCLGELEAGLNTIIPAERTIAAFRFEVIPGAPGTAN